MESDLPTLDNKGELLRRLPEIQDINDHKIRELTIEIFLEDVPDYFWLVPASSSGKYHPPDHRGKYGLWLHTKRAFSVFDRLSRSAQHQNDLSPREISIGKSAILLHDMFKQGREKTGHTVSEHDKIAYEYLNRKDEVPEKLLECVHSHNGPWGSGRDPETKLEKIHHYADMIASGEKSTIQVKSPVPSEIEEVMNN